MSSSSSSSFALSLDYDIVLLLTNISGFIDGFLQSYDTGVVLPVGATTEAIRLLYPKIFVCIILALTRHGVG